MADSGESASFHFEAALYHIALRMPDELMDAEAAQRLAQCASTLPGSASQSMFGFEMRLGDAAALCDLFLEVLPNSPIGSDLTASGRSRTALAGERNLGRLLRELQERESFLSRWFGRVILEYDLIDGGETGRFHPGLFLTPAFPENGALPDDTPVHQTANSGVLVAAMCAATGQRGSGGGPNGV